MFIVNIPIDVRLLLGLALSNGRERRIFDGVFGDGGLYERHTRSAGEGVGPREVSQNRLMLINYNRFGST